MPTRDVLVRREAGADTTLEFDRVIEQLNVTSIFVDKRTQLSESKKGPISECSKSVDTLVEELQAAYLKIPVNQVNLVLSSIGNEDGIEKKMLASLAEAPDISASLRDYGEAIKAEFNNEVGLPRVTFVGAPVEVQERALIQVFLDERERAHTHAVDFARRELAQAKAWEGFDSKLVDLLTAFRVSKGSLTSDAECKFFDALISVIQNITGKKNLGPKGSDGLKSAIDSAGVEFSSRAIAPREMRERFNLAYGMGDSIEANALRDRLKADMVFNQVLAELDLLEFLANKANVILGAEVESGLMRTTLETFKSRGKKLVADHGRRGFDALSSKTVSQDVGWRVKLGMMRLPSVPQWVKRFGILTTLGAAASTPWTLAGRDISDDLRWVRESALSAMPELSFEKPAPVVPPPVQTQALSTPTEWRSLEPQSYPTDEMPTVQWIHDLAAYEKRANVEDGALAIWCLDGKNTSDGSRPSQVSSFPIGSPALNLNGEVNWEVPSCKIPGFKSFSPEDCVDRFCKEQGDGFFAVALTPEAQ